MKKGILSGSTVGLVFVALLMGASSAALADGMQVSSKASCVWFS